MYSTRVIVSRVYKKFGGATALDGVTLKIAEGEVYGLVGPNGSGKTTLINVISGLIQPDLGEVLIEGKKINGQPPYAECFRSLSRSFQIPKPWSKLSVLSNLMIPAMCKGDGVNLNEAKEKALQMLDRLQLTRLMNEPANTLSGGQLKLLEFGRALITSSDVILLDEPFAGISPGLQPVLIDMIRERAKTGTSFLVVSHIISTIVQSADRVGVMARGKLVVEGKPGEALSSKLAIEEYLGGKVVA